MPNVVTTPAFYGGQDAGLRRTVELERLFQAAYDSKFTELTYSVGGDLETVEVWETASKLIKLFTRTLTYTGDDLTQVVTVDDQAGTILTVTLGYTGDDLTSVDKVFT